MGQKKEKEGIRNKDTNLYKQDEKTQPKVYVINRHHDYTSFIYFKLLIRFISLHKI